MQHRTDTPDATRAQYVATQSDRLDADIALARAGLSMAPRGHTLWGLDRRAVLADLRRQRRATGAYARA